MASLETTQERTRSEIADYLRQFADELDPDSHSSRSNAADSGRADTNTEGNGGQRPIETSTEEGGLLDGDDIDDRDRHSNVGDKVTVIAGNESATINPPRTCLFDVAIDTDSDLLDTGAERSTTFTIRWSEEQVAGDDELRVE